MPFPQHEIQTSSILQNANRSTVYTSLFLVTAMICIGCMLLPYGAKSATGMQCVTILSRATQEKGLKVCVKGLHCFQI